MPDKNRPSPITLVTALLLVTAYFLFLHGAAGAADRISISCDRWPDCSSLENFADDCVRLAGATTSEEKAIALWRYIQQTTENGSAPKEPAYGTYYVLSPLKILNVYGVHWCDGLSRVMTMGWRDLGYRAEKLYKFGHTLADCCWKDPDGVERWHVFDLNQHWFVYDRTGTHIATKDELALDHSLIYFPSRTPVPGNPSLMQPSYVHAGHLLIRPFETGITLRRGESITRLWGNEGKPYYNLFGKKERRDFEHGPYPITYGNGKIIYEPDLSQPSFLEDLHKTSDNLTCIQSDSGSPALHPIDTAKPGIAVIPISLPYVISDAWMSATIMRSHQDDMIRFYISANNGQTWRKIWQSGGKPGTLSISDVNFCETFSPSTKEIPNIITPFGRYDYFLKVEITPSRNASVCGLNELSVTTVFQHNIFALPMLWPDKNTISVRGNMNQGTALQITYVWQEKGKQERSHTIETDTLPFRYELSVNGKNWDDIVCKQLRVALISAAGRHEPSASSSVSADSDTTASKPVPYPTEKSIGSYHPERLRSVQDYIADIRNLLNTQADPEIQPNTLKKLSKQIGHHVLALSSLQKPEAGEVLEQVIVSDGTTPYQNKVWACQALYLSVGNRAAQTMMRILERDPKITWNDPEKRWSRDAMWFHTVHMAAAILAAIRDFRDSERAADLIGEILQGKKTAVPPRNIWRGEEICWGLIRDLGRLGTSRHVPILKSFLAEKSDATAVAIQALNDIGDSSVLPDILPILDNFEYSPIGLYSIAAVGTMGSPEMGDHLYRFLNHWDEDFRGAAAEALGNVGDINALSRLREVADKDPFPWVADAAKKSFELLEQAEKDALAK